VVIGHAADEIRQERGDLVDYAVQNPQLGTGHAVQAAEEYFKGSADPLVVISADMPLLTPKTLTEMAELQQKSGSVMVMLSIHSEASFGFGRIIRDVDGKPVAVVEEAQATQEQLNLTELNAGVYCFDTRWLWDVLFLRKSNPRPGLDIVFPCPEIILSGRYSKHDNRRTVRRPRSDFLQPGHCLIKLPADIHVFDDLNLTGYPQENANIRRRSRLIKSKLDFRTRLKLGHQRLYPGRVEIESRDSRIPRGHRTDVRPVALYRGEKGVRVSSNKFNAVI